MAQLECDFYGCRYFIPRAASIIIAPAYLLTCSSACLLVHVVCFVFKWLSRIGFDYGSGDEIIVYPDSTNITAYSCLWSR